MNNIEYGRWFAELLRAYPEVAKRFNEGSADAEPWEKALADTPLQHALAAIDAMVKGDIAKPEYGWSDLPKIVRLFSFTQANNELAEQTASYEGESGCRVNCNYCFDTGSTRIWNPLFVGDREQNIMLCEDRHAVFQLHRDWRDAQRRENPKRVAHGYGALCIVVVCTCDHPASQIRRGQIDAWRQSGMPSNKTPVPCYVYRPKEWDVFKLGEPGELQ